MKKILFTILSICILGTLILSGCNSTKTTIKEKPSETVMAEIETEMSVHEVTLSLSDFNILKENGIISGVKEYKVERDTNIKLSSLIAINQEIVEQATINESAVKYDTPGEYKVPCSFTLDNKKIKEYEGKHNTDFNLPKEADQVIVKTEIKITVVEDAKTVQSEGETVISNTTVDQIIEDNLSEVTGTPGPATTVEQSQQRQNATPPVNNNTEQPTQHTHKWIRKTETIHHDAVTHEEPVYETVHHDAVYENVWVEDSAAWDETIGCRLCLMCTECFAYFYGEGGTKDEAWENAYVAWRAHDLAEHDEWD